MYATYVYMLRMLCMYVCMYVCMYICMPWRLWHSYELKSSDYEPNLTRFRLNIVFRCVNLTERRMRFTRSFPIQRTKERCPSASRSRQRMLRWLLATKPPPGRRLSRPCPANTVLLLEQAKRKEVAISYARLLGLEE